MKILIVDDHALFREALGNTLRHQPDFEVVVEAGSIEETMQQVHKIQPDIVLLDISLPDGSGLDALKVILEIRPETSVIMLTAHDTSSMLLTAITNGAKGYLLKNIPVAKLLASLRGIRKGEVAISRTMTGSLVNELVRLNTESDHQIKGEDSKKPDILEALTPREREVLRELATDASNLEIADRLVIAENTVKIHVHRILKKLNLYNRHDAARLGRQVFGKPS